MQYLDTVGTSFVILLDWMLITWAARSINCARSRPFGLLIVLREHTPTHTHTHVSMDQAFVVCSESCVFACVLALTFNRRAKRTKNKQANNASRHHKNKSKQLQQQKTCDKNESGVKRECIHYSAKYSIFKCSGKCASTSILESCDQKTLEC